MLLRGSSTRQYLLSTERVDPSTLQESAVKKGDLGTRIALVGPRTVRIRRSHAKEDRTAVYFGRPRYFRTGPYACRNRDIERYFADGCSNPETSSIADGDAISLTDPSPDGRTRRTAEPNAVAHSYRETIK